MNETSLQIIRADYEMTREEAELVNGLLNRTEADFRFYLLKMRDEKGWKALGYASFDEYGEKARGLTGRRLYQLAEAAEVQLSLENGKIFQKIPDAHLRPLAPLSDEERRQVWAEVNAQVQEEDCKLTAQRVAEAVAALDQERTRSAEWREQALAKEAALKKAQDAATLKAQELRTLREEIDKTAERMANAKLADIKLALEQARIDKAEAEAKLKAKSKAMAEQVATGVKLGLQGQQDEINRREAQLRSIEGRIAVLSGRLNAVTEQDQAVAHYETQVREIRKCMDALALHLSHSFDQDFAAFLPESHVPAFERLAIELAKASEDIRKALTFVEIRAIEVATHE